jgi:hypothetical protein
MATRSVQEISLEMKKSILKLLDASRQAMEAEKERTIATIELSNLQKELEKIEEK